FPPRTAAGWDDLFGTISHFEELHPSFVSVTYGAGGSTRDQTNDLVLRLRSKTTLDPMPHLTCVGHSEAEIMQILQRYAQAGVSNILALRGDAPKGQEVGKGSYAYAADLVAAIRACGERVGHPDPRGFGIGVAGFPEGHPQTPNTLVQMDHLKAKVDAGADFIVTQLFFDTNAFFDWKARCELAGVRAPIVAGIMPITTMAGLRRMADLAAGARFPAPLLRALSRCQDDPESVANVGIHWATEQCRDLLDRGVAGIHLYTLNKSDATRRIYKTLGLVGRVGATQGAG
ncbi:MAG: methylenetetrahydrofolate reductase [NAD(P)H], partial [Phycisphaerae bacterium]|nr:methylenetetrahydrofolate reductase [NAD(P)H] [Phycisphaerae bacterium]